MASIKNKVISFAVCTALLLTMMPKVSMPVFAEGTDNVGTDNTNAEALLIDNGTETYYDTLEEAIAAADSSQNGSTVKLLSDLTTESMVKVKYGGFTIDLNGKNWISTVTSSFALYLYANIYEVTLKDSTGGGSLTNTVSNDEPMIYENGGSITIESGTYNCVGENMALFVNNANDQNKKNTIKGGTFINTGSQNSPVVINESSASICGGEFYGEYSGIGITNCNNVSLTGGSYKEIWIYSDYPDESIDNIGEALVSGYAYQNTSDNTWVSDLSQSDIYNVAVTSAPVKITEQPKDVQAISDYTTAPTLSLTAEAANSGDAVDYQWYKSDGTAISGATSASYTVPTGLSLGNYSYYCVVSCNGYNTKSETAKVTVSKKDGIVANHNYAIAYNYTGSSIPAPTAENFKTNSGGAMTFTWYKGASTAEADNLSGAPKDVGDYTLKADLSGTDNYTPTSLDLGVTIGYYKTTAVATLSGEINDGWYGNNGDPVDITAPSGFLISTSNDDSAVWNDKITNADEINGNFTYYLKEKSTGFITDKKEIAVKYDKTAPTIGTISYSEHQSFLDWIFHKEKIDVSINVSDALSGISQVYYCLDNDIDSTGGLANVENGVAKISVGKDDVGTLSIRVYDNAGNHTNITVTKVAVEGNAPTLAVLDGLNEWNDSCYTEQKKIFVDASDYESGLKSVSYSIDGNTAVSLFDREGRTALSNQFIASNVNVLEGSHTYTVTAVDNALNVTTKTVTITQDTLAPTLSNLSGTSITDTKATLNFTSNENGTCYYVLQKASEPDLSGGDVIGSYTDPKSIIEGSNSITPSNLSPNTEYDCYIVPKDEVGNISTTVYKIHFKTTKVSISNSQITFDKSDFTYNGSEQKPTVTVNCGGKTLTENTDYTLSYKNSNGGDGNTTNAGTVTVTITAAGDYDGSLTKTFEIKKAPLTPKILGTASKEYDGNTTISDGLSISLDGIQKNDAVTASATYTIENKNVGTAKKVTASNIVLKNDGGNYCLASEEAFSNCAEITPKEVDVTISGDKSFIYNGTASYSHTASYETVGGDTASATVLYDGNKTKPLNASSYTLGATINDSNYKIKTCVGIDAFTISKCSVPINLSQDKENPVYGDSVTITATLDRNNIINPLLAPFSGNIKAYICDGSSERLIAEKDVKNFNKTVSVTFDYNELPAGINHIKFVYSGNNNFYDCVRTADITVAKRTLEWNTSGLSSTKKEDNTTYAPINGNISLSGVLKGTDPGFSYKSITGNFDSEAAGTHTVLVDVENPVISNSNYLLPSEKPTFTGKINAVSEITNVPESTDTNIYKLQLEDGFSDIPQSIKNIPSLDTETKLEAQLKLSVEKALNGVKSENISAFDITLTASFDGGNTWEKVDDSNFPKEGITIILPYPDGSNKDDYDFVITHMFTTGDKVGMTETIIPEKTSKGLKFKLYSLSPVAVGYKAIVKENPQNIPNPKTGDFGMMIPALIGISFGGSYIVFRKKKSKK